jgi:hypothetical protein
MFQFRSPESLREEERPELGLVAQIGFEGRSSSKSKWRPGNLTIRPQSERSAREGKLVPGARSLLLTAGL